MDKKSLYNLYEKTYFYEMEVREKIVGRVQINFALIATGFAALSYMSRMLDLEKNNILIIAFIALLLTSIMLSFICIRHLVLAFWGNEYQGMPTAIEIDSYRLDLLAHAQDIEKYNLQYPEAAQPKVYVDQMLYDYMYNKFRDCSSFNTKVNDKRSDNLHKSFRWLLYSSIPFLLASVLFVIGNLDVSSPRKETLIINNTLNEKLESIENTLNVLTKANGVNMSNKTPPPPPPPSQPPSRKVIQKERPVDKMQGNQHVR